MEKNFLSVIVMIGLSITMSAKVYSQYLNDQATGKPIIMKTYTDIVGSPYLSDDWAKGVVKLDNGDTYKDNLYLKYNQLNDELYFRSKNDETLAFVNSVKEFTITYGNDNVIEEKHYKNGFKNIPGANSNTNFEILADGTVQLLKRVSVTISESKEFNSAVIKKAFERNYKYYLIIGNNVSQVRSDKNTILKVLGNKRGEVETYIKTNKLNLKSDSELAQVIKYYNSI